VATRHGPISLWEIREDVEYEYEQEYEYGGGVAGTTQSSAE
jgi:hypothetical protein